MLADNDAPAWRHTALELSHRVHLLQCELRDAAEAAERLQANADLMYVALSEEEEVTRRRADEARVASIAHSMIVACVWSILVTVYLCHVRLHSTGDPVGIGNGCR